MTADKEEVGLAEAAAAANDIKAPNLLSILLFNINPSAKIRFQLVFKMIPAIIYFVSVDKKTKTKKQWHYFSWRCVCAYI